MTIDRLLNERAIDVGLKPELAHLQRSAIDVRVDPPDQLIAKQQRADVPAPDPLLRRFVDLPHVIEVEEVAHEVAVPEQWIERPEDADAIVEADPFLRQK